MRRIVSYSGRGSSTVCSDGSRETSHGGGLSISGKLSGEGVGDLDELWITGESLFGGGSGISKFLGSWPRGGVTRSAKRALGVLG